MKFDRAIRGVAPAPDGSVYVLDHEAKLRKYTVAKGASCDLILDTKFGQAGILTILPDAKEADSFDTLAIDGKGNVYISGFIAKAKKVAGGQVSEACSKSGRLYVDPKGSAAYLGSDKVDLDAGCKPTPFKADVAKDDGSPQILSPAGADVIGVFNGKVKDKWVYKVGLFDGSGKKTFLAGEMEGDAKMCNVGTVAACGAGICVVDANCRGLKAFDKSGKIQGSVAIGSLIGLSYPWPRAFALGADAAYLAATHAAVDSKADKMQYGMVFRIKGLN
ncbi:MAG: hypothetical protein IPK82_32890 [Polyangiaceae bacterium]|nr:hypothetical protein [Polyangiaceae bacterium]